MSRGSRPGDDIKCRIISNPRTSYQLTRFHGFVEKVEIRHSNLMKRNLRIAIETVAASVKWSDIKARSLRPIGDCLWTLPKRESATI